MKTIVIRLAATVMEFVLGVLVPVTRPGPEFLAKFQLVRTIADTMVAVLLSLPLPRIHLVMPNVPALKDGMELLARNLFASFLALVRHDRSHKLFGFCFSFFGLPCAASLTEFFHEYQEMESA